MANRIYISIIGTGITLSSVCTEDISVQAQSQFSRIGDFIPGISSLASMLLTAESTTSGGVGGNLLNVQNALDVPIWQKTEPVKVTTDLNFFVKTSGFYDVWRPTMILQSLSILSIDPENSSKLITPGLNIGDISKEILNNKENAQNLIGKESQGGNDLSNALISAKASDIDERTSMSGDIPKADKYTTSYKFCSVYIPSIVYIPKAIVEVAQPTWSKQKTDKGYPIWSKVNVQFTGLISAVAENNFLNIDPQSMGTISI